MNPDDFEYPGWFKAYAVITMCVIGMWLTCLV